MSLTVGGDTIGHAVLLDVRVSNSGRRPLGSDREPWQLALGTRDRAGSSCCPT